jgi:hypothetical protein
VVFLQSVVQTGPEPNLGQLFDIDLLALPGGRAKTAVEFAAHFKRSGFTLTKIVPTKSLLSVVEAERMP